MDSFLKFLKDWVPTIGVLIGAFWILFKWIYEEALRVKKEMPALDGKLNESSMTLDKHKRLLTLEALWVNRSPNPIYFNYKDCKILIYKLMGEDLKLNAQIDFEKDLGNPICSHYFLQGKIKENYFFEPHTESVLVNNYVLEPGLYAIRMVLYGIETHQIWWKEKIVDLRPDLK